MLHRSLSILIAGVFMAGFPHPAYAAPDLLPTVGCYGDWCSGRDPQDMGCAADAITLNTAYLPGSQAILELRWSPRCKTEWARVSGPGGWGSGDTLSVTQPKSGYRQVGVSGSFNGYIWSRMIYSPSQCVYGEWTKLNWATIQTWCV